MSDNTAIIILAAGKGTRMKSNLPKVLHPIGGRTMIEHVIHTARALKPKKIVTVLSPDMSDVANAISHYSDIAIQKEQYGTAHAVQSALPALKGFKGNVLVLYADTPLVKRSTMASMLKTLNKKTVVSVLGFTPLNPAEYGRLIVNNASELERIVEFKDANAQERKIALCNSGLVAATMNDLRTLLKKVKNNNANGEYYLTDIVSLAAEMGNTCKYVHGDEDEVLGVNSRVQLAEAESIFQKRAREEAMHNGATLIDPTRVYFAYDTKLGKDVVVEPNVFFAPGVKVADNVRVRANSYLEDCSVSKGCIIGPFARIRPGTKLADNAKVGNFVEIKKSDIGRGSKVNHFTYVGDSSIGKDVNIGAGTITCNYDGYSKHKTTIEDNVFIGSNVALVAPVKIGKGAIVAAGSTITRNVAPDALGVARGKQDNKKDYAKQFRKKNKK